MTTKNIGKEAGYLPLPTNFMTKAIHSGQSIKQWNSLAVVAPITTTAPFAQDENGESAEFVYGRAGNPTRNILEINLASLENAKYALTYASGLGAVTAIVSLLKSGDHFLSGNDIYGGTGSNFRKIAVNFGIEPSFVDTTDLKVVEAAIQPNTKMLWIEIPTNPTFIVSDVEALSKLCKKHNIILVVDNSFLTPYLHRPLEFGADIVMYFLSKYMNGHSDVCMGSVATNNEDIFTKLKFLQIVGGIIPSPFDCYQVNRGLDTLALRMKQHNKNANKVATYLMTHPKVIKVIHPGFSTHPQFEIFKKQCSGHSGMIGLYLKGNLEDSKKFLASLKIFIWAASLGGVQSLAELPLTLSHSSVPRDHLKKLNITDNYIRLSVGIEDPEDLIGDLSQALDKI